MIYDTDCVVSKKQKDKKVIQDSCSTNIPDQQSLDGSMWTQPPQPFTDVSPVADQRSCSDWPVPLVKQWLKILSVPYTNYIQ